MINFLLLILIFLNICVLVILFQIYRKPIFWKKEYNLNKNLKAHYNQNDIQDNIKVRHEAHVTYLENLSSNFITPYNGYLCIDAKSVLLELPDAAIEIKEEKEIYIKKDTIIRITNPIELKRAMFIEQ